MNKYVHFLFILFIISVAFAESLTPYLIAEKQCLPSKVFLGQIREPLDQNMYFSFIRQSFNGKFLLNDRLTYLPGKNVFVNIEFWLVGFLQRITGCSENGIYQLWRFLGTLALIFGFAFVAKNVIQSTRRYLLSVLLFVFGGGAGFLFIHLDKTRFNGSSIMKWGMIDLRASLAPFQQLMLNPHFSLPHGFFLISVGFFLLAERKNKMIYYILTGLMFNVIGLARPYDLISVFAVIPLFATVEWLRKGPDIKTLIKRMLPLLMSVPVLLYNIWLFKFEDIFKYWSQQGANALKGPTAPWIFLAYGAIGFFAVFRLLQIAKYPLSKNEIFVAIWFEAIFSLSQAGRFLPILGFSPQLGVPLFGPLVILGCSVHKPEFLKGKSVYLFHGLFVILIASVILSNIEMWRYAIKIIREDKEQTVYYADKGEMDAWDWMRENIAPGKVVLAGYITSSRICKYTNASVVIGHYSVTPHFLETFKKAYDIFANTAWDLNKRNQLSDLNVDYLYLGPELYKPDRLGIDTTGFMKLVYKNEITAIYKVDRIKE
jgi:hypothetical protein